MKTNLNHIQINIDYSNINFYKELFTFLGWKVIVETDGILGFGSDVNGSIWFLAKKSEHTNDYDGNGVNHIGIGADSISSVDETVNYLKSKNVTLLFDTPKHRPEFASGEETYYQVMFESPDKILWEVVYYGPKN